MQPMKRTFRSAIWPLLGLLTVACAAPDGRNLPAAEDFESLSAQFAAPSKEYSSAPLFVWNKVVTPERIDEAMADLKDKGFGGVFVHPRPGMVTQYLDDNWFSLFRHTMEKGRELDMNVWIYDENSYPSGFAGGHVNEAMPESYDEGVALKYLRAGVLPDTVDRFFCCLRREGDAFTDITAEAVSRRGEKGDYYLFYKAYNPTSPWYSGFSYVDLMHEGVADKFIELTLDGYKKVVGEEFGGTVPGWFTDEPQIVVTDRESIRWTPDLFDAFRARWGYDLEPNLVSLWEEVGPWRQVRHNYRDVLMNLFLDRYIKVCHDYCERNNLVFTGHFWEHGWPDMGHNPDNMAMYAWQQMPGIDLLYNKFDVESPNAHFGNVRSVKEVNSAANQMGRVRKLSESYGGGGWDMTLRDFKRQGDWEYALGVNFMNQHIAPLSIAGARKYDYPPAFTPHSPWWEYYRELNLHFARLSLALSSGGQYNDVLVLEPTTSIWMYYTYNAPRSNRWRTMGEEFQAFITALERHQVEFDLGSENILLNHGSVKGDRFVVGKRAYGTVVLPAQMENVDAATFDLLERFAAKGGRIIAYGTPQYVDGARSAEAEAFFADPAKVTCADAGEPIDYSLFATPEIAFDAPEGNYLFHHRRRMDDGQLLFLANSSLTRPVRGTVTLQGRQAALLDTRTGEIRGYEAQREGDRLTIAYDLHPAGSLLLYVFDEEREGLAPAPARRVLTAVPAAGGLTAKPDAPNVMTIDFCDLELDGKVYPDLNSYDAAKLAYQHHGFKAGNPWSTSVQFRDHTVRRDTFTMGGFKASYRFTVTSGVDRSRLQAVVEQPELYRVTLNGVELKALPDKHWIDPEMRFMPLGDAVRTGENVLTMECSPMRVLAEIEPIYILGDFRLEPAAKGWNIVAPGDFAAGSWKAQGWPCYPGKVTYAREFDIAEKAPYYEVALGEWKGTVCEVLVNGRSAGIVYAEPYTVDVTEWIAAGRNRVEVKVVGSNYNLMGPLHAAHFKRITPAFWRGVKEYPSGKDYVQQDYGLMGDFTLAAGR